MKMGGIERRLKLTHLLFIAADQSADSPVPLFYIKQVLPFGSCSKEISERWAMQKPEIEESP